MKYWDNKMIYKNSLSLDDLSISLSRHENSQLRTTLGRQK